MFSAFISSIFQPAQVFVKCPPSQYSQSAAVAIVRDAASQNVCTPALVSDDVTSLCLLTQKTILNVANGKKPGSQSLAW